MGICWQEWTSDGSILKDSNVYNTVFVMFASVVTLCELVCVKQVSVKNGTNAMKHSRKKTNLLK